MKAIIPVAGAGTNLRPLTYTQPKALIPIAGKPILGYILDSLIEADVDQFIFVVGYLGEKVRAYVEKNYPSIEKSFPFQSDRRGLGHAIWTAHSFLEPDDDVIIVLGDTILELDWSEFIRSDRSCLGVKKVSDPRKFGVVEVDQKGKVKQLIEKPNIPKSNLAIAGVYKVKTVGNLIHTLDQIIHQNESSNKEIELTDGLMELVRNGDEFFVQEVSNWFDCGNRRVLLETNARILERNHNGGSHNFENTIIIPPVFLGRKCKISNSIIGPNVSVGTNVKIKSSIIDDSIIGDYSHLKRVALHRSVIGQDVSINGMHQSLNIGDNTEIDFS